MRRARPMAEDPTTMSSTTEEGFVKKLFFPAYTDAGFDESFHRATTIVMQKEKLETSLTESVVSEASTAIRDNRSHRTAASGSVDTTPARRFQNQKIPSTFAAAHHHHHQPPSFFASTKPAATATIVVHPQHAYLLPVPPSPASAAPRNMPVSPPKVARMPVTIRNVSTEAVINNTTRSQSKTEATTNSRFAFLDVDNDDDDDDSNGEASFKDASSIAIVRKTSQATYDVTEDALTYVRSGESSDGSSSISVALALPPVSMFDDTTETEVDPTSWEEEATPAETAFGKMLLFQRVLRSPDDDNHEDVLSTASQNGSIVDNDDTGCNDSEPNVVATNAWDDAVVQPNASAESGGGASLQSLYTTPPQEEYSDPVWDESDLSMPVLENAASVVAAARENDKKLPSRRGTTNHHGVDNEEEKEMEHHEAAVATTTTTTESRVIGTEDNKNNKSYTLGAQSNAASEVVKQQGATGMLSMAIRRLGSGLTGNSRQINNNSSKHFSSLSAPTTPRASSFNAPRSPPTDGAEATTPRSLALSLMSPLQKVVATAAAAAENDGTTTTTTGKSRNNLPSSFLLRSPGSAAFQAASKDSSGSYPHIPPRFTSWPGGSNQQQQQRRNMFSKIPEDEEGIRDDDNHNLIRPSVNNSNAFQIARSCFSFDAFDTSMDEQYEFTIPNNHYDTAATKQAPCLDSSSDLSRQLLTLDLNTTTTSWQPEPPIVNFSVAGSDQQQQHTRRTHINASTVELSTSPSQERNNHSPNRVLIGSASWDVGFAPQQQRAPAFRPRSERIRGNLSSILRPTKSVSSPRNNRVRSTSDFIPITLTAAAAAGNYDSETTQQLRSPERIELEREDALDILACLVERGVSWKQETVSSGDDADVGTGQQEDGDGAKEDSPKRQTQDLGSPSPSTSDIAAIVKELQDLSLAEEKLGDFYDNSEAHMKRKLALEELLRSHEYAVEMKRASLSASSWLKSIGRSQSSSPSKAGSPARNTIISETTTNDDLPSRTSTPKTETPDSSQQAAGEESSASENIDLLTAKAMLHTALMEAKEKSELADRLNEELAKCRAEIGRLKSSAQVTSFRSPNRSILDESDDMSVTEGDEDEAIHVLDQSFDSGGRVVDESDCLNSSFLREGLRDESVAVESELDSYKAALNEANAIIRTLFNKQSYGDTDEAPVITIPLKVDTTMEPSKLSPGYIEQRTVNVRMLDSENFVTEWDDLAPPLLGPPEHDLRSPIVAAVLDEWTSDRNLHEALLAWIDHILAGSDPGSIPPLTLSSLDHQVRDGFLLHIIPLLLRRPDIRLDVKTRVHRRTSYDIAVSIDSTAVRDRPQFSHDMRHHLLERTSARSDGGLSTTNSFATTAVISNTALEAINLHPKVYGSNGNFIDGNAPQVSTATSSRLSYDEMTEDISSPDDPQPGLISALGGALGGLLIRRKGAANHESLPPHGPQGGMQTILESPASAGLAHEISGLAAETDDDQPYHRVVMAPSGRIGVTLVEYRGHCMVSDVYPDSPLIGWIFPSDVLIAIDELPVSGMRVRDIIQVLKDRTHSQRALRVISSHAMNEFTLNASIVVADETS